MTKFRPIQYLGNKLRALDQICDVTDALLPHRGRIADLFTGSTIVAQALANRGYELTAIDTQTYSQVFATAFLSINRKENEPCIAGELINHPATERIRTQFGDWEAYASDEDKLIARGDSLGLRKLYGELPLIWRDKRNPYFKLVTAQECEVRRTRIPLVTSIYAGSYFGVRQALELDQVRQSIFDLHNNGSISKWQVNAALASLLSAASSAVHSAGKHFAQPLSTSETTCDDFKDRRMLQDRAVSIQDALVRCSTAINDSGHHHERAEHAAYTDTAEHFVATNPGHYDLFYVDPPYTAQQYSRFYHVLETMCTYETPDLLDRDRITTGLYPKNRFKSAFCSKIKALPAMENIVHGAKRRNANLLISYSHSLSGSYGNARMISFKELIKTCRRHFGARSVETWTFGHRYRQFNSALKANKNRSDPEVLIACRIG